MPDLLLLVLATLVWFPASAVGADVAADLALLAQCQAQACQRRECEIPTTCCLQQPQQQIFNSSSCLSVCDCAENGTVVLDPAPCPALPAPSLHCRTDDLLSVSWSRPGLDLAVDNVYLLEILARGGSWISSNITRRQIGYVSGLQPGAEYQLRVTSFGPRGRRCTSPPSAWFSTAPTKDHVPDAPPSLELEPIDFSRLPALARFRWTAGKDPACTYLVVLFPGRSDRVVEKEDDVREKFREVAFEVNMDENYTFLVRGYSPNMVAESTPTKLDVRTKSCIEARGHRQCAPPLVSDVSVTAVRRHNRNPKPLSRVGDVFLDITVNWSPPPVDPLLYRVIIREAHIFVKEHSVEPRVNITVAGNATRATIRDVSVSPSFLTEVWAESEVGVGPSALVLFELPVADHAGWPTTWLVVAACSLFLAIAVAVVALACHRRTKASVSRHRQRFFENLDHIQKVPDNSGSLMVGGVGRQVMSVPYSALEGCFIPASSLILLETLGAGCFGTVCKGVLTSPDGRMEDVAVKRLRDDATAEEVRQFWLEIALMKSVGQHKNIVSMVGCCVDADVTRLVVEYCALGDLQRFLREAAKAMSELDEPDLKYIALCHSDSDSDDSDYERQARTNGLNAVSNATYGLNLEETGTKDKAAQGLRLLPKDLLAIARQVATGMEFLASTRVVHRDLAARNVLVCEDRTVKISDFGLSRDIYEQNVYHQSGYDKVPIKWMAMESLLHREYTTQSDVWSFGVLLWEIVTFGGSPYPSIPNNGLFQHLQQGYRMERPANCSPELYAVMRQCWGEKPSERPTFTDLKKSLDELLETTAGRDGSDYLPLFAD